MNISELLGWVYPIRSPRAFRKWLVYRWHKDEE